MRILHTSDWHLGRRLGRYDRLPELMEVLAEVQHIADEHTPDLVILSGDLFDRPLPTPDVLRLGLEALQGLAKNCPVVGVAGNHDSPELFEALAPLLRPIDIHLVGSIKRPDEGGVLGSEELGINALIACFPFLREGRVVDFMRDAGEWYGQYAAKVQAISGKYNEELVRRTGPKDVPVLTAHFMVSGVKVDREAPRGERELHMGEAYTATPQAIPVGPQYVAMGHIHAPQAVPHSPVPAEYAGSLVSLDFGEAGERKRVVVVDATPGSLAVAKTIPLHSGRPLVRVTGTWEEIEERAAELKDAYLDLTVKTSGTDTTLSERARESFPEFLVKVRALRPVDKDRPRPSTERRELDELYTEFYRREVDESGPSQELISLLREILEETSDAAT